MPLDEAVAGTTEPLAGLGEPRVPHVERRRRVCVEPAADLSQQRVALAHDAIELEPQRRRT